MSCYWSKTDHENKYSTPSFSSFVPFYSFHVGSTSNKIFSFPLCHLLSSYCGRFLCLDVSSSVISFTSDSCRTTQTFDFLVSTENFRTPDYGVTFNNSSVTQYTFVSPYVIFEHLKTRFTSLFLPPPVLWVKHTSCSLPRPYNDNFPSLSFRSSSLPDFRNLFLRTPTLSSLLIYWQRTYTHWLTYTTNSTDNFKPSRTGTSPRTHI